MCSEVISEFVFFFDIFYCICAIQECIKFETSFKLHKILILSRWFWILVALFSMIMLWNITQGIKTSTITSLSLCVLGFDQLKPFFQNSITTFHVLLCNLLTFCKMLLRRFSVAFEKCYLGDFPFARTWDLPSCILFSPLFWVFWFINVWQVFF
jgi:hypothetical protein